MRTRIAPKPRTRARAAAMIVIIAVGQPLLVACGTRTEADVQPYPHRVELLGFGGCPNTPELMSRLRAALALSRLGQVLDVVPNHLAAAPENAWWWDVLESGEASEHASWFDIDWEQHGGRVLMPVLGRRLDDDLEHIRLDGEVVRYTFAWRDGNLIRA